MLEITSPLRCSLVLERVLDREHAAPGVAEQVEVVAVQAERPAHLLDLVDEARDRPQVRCVRLVAPGRAELVVVVVLDPGGGEVGVEGGEVLVRRTRSAVQEQDLDPRVVADAPGPDPELAASACVIGIIRTPPERTSSRPELSKYRSGGCNLHPWLGLDYRALPARRRSIRVLTRVIYSQHDSYRQSQGRASTTASSARSRPRRRGPHPRRRRASDGRRHRSVSIPAVAREAGVSVPTDLPSFRNEARPPRGGLPTRRPPCRSRRLVVPALDGRASGRGARVLRAHSTRSATSHAPPWPAPRPTRCGGSACPDRLAMFRQGRRFDRARGSEVDRDRIARLLVILTASSALRMWRDQLGSSVDEAADDVDWVVRAAIAAALGGTDDELALAGRVRRLRRRAHGRCRRGRREGGQPGGAAGGGRPRPRWGGADRPGRPT